MKRLEKWLGEFNICAEDHEETWLTLSWRSYIAGNTMVEAVNAKSLGWKPQAPGFFETLKETSY